MRKKVLIKQSAYIIVSLIIINTGKSFSQCSTANAGNDVTLCTSSQDGVTIGTTAVSGYTYSWSPATGLNNPNIAQPTASPTSTTTYTLRMIPTSTNLISNGTFESGYTGFGSDYPSTCCSGPGWVAVGGIAYNLDCNSGPFMGSNMLIATGHYNNNQAYRIWYQTISVAQNTDYVFSGFISCPNAHTVYDINMIGNISGSSNQNHWLEFDNCNNWRVFSMPWNSGNNTAVTLEFRFSSWSNVQDRITLDNLFFGNCPQSTDQVTVFVEPSAPVISPAGPITYYNEYETQSQIQLNSTPAASYQWYKNNVAISGATEQSLKIKSIGNTTYMDYYKVVTPCGTSNIVTYNYIGCDSPGDYPVSIPGVICNSAITPPNYVQLNAPSLGSGTTYNWWTKNPGCFSISSTGRLTADGCSGWENEGIYTKSTLGGAETYMYYLIVNNPGCRMAGGDNALKNPVDEPSVIISKTQLLPNPAREKVAVRSKDAINKIEIYNMSGIRVRDISVSKLYSTIINTSTFKPGIYSVKVITDKGSESLRLVIQQ